MADHPPRSPNESPAREWLRYSGQSRRSRPVVTPWLLAPAAFVAAGHASAALMLTEGSIVHARIAGGVEPADGDARQRYRYEDGEIIWSLERGVLSAVAESEDALVSVEIVGLPYVVDVLNGSAGVLTNGRGSFMVTCARGAAVIRTAGQPITVAAGYEFGGGESQQATLNPSRPLVLDVSPVGPLTKPQAVLVRGTTRPGSLLMIGGEHVIVDHDGAFAHTVQFSGKPLSLVIQARNALNERREVVLALAAISPVAPVRRPAKPRPPQPGGPGFRPLKTKWEWDDSPGGVSTDCAMPAIALSAERPDESVRWSAHCQIVARECGISPTRWPRTVAT